MMPQISDARGRAAVREVLDLAAGYGYSEDTLLANVNELTAPQTVNRSELRRFVEWNHSKGYLRKQLNEDTDEVEIYITKAGIAKQQIQ